MKARDDNYTLKFNIQSIHTDYLCVLHLVIIFGYIRKAEDELTRNFRPQYRVIFQIIYYNHQLLFQGILFVHTHTHIDIGYSPNIL
jgi:hypothetical protein